MLHGWYPTPLIPPGVIRHLSYLRVLYLRLWENVGSSDLRLWENVGSSDLPFLTVLSSFTPF